MIAPLLLAFQLAVAQTPKTLAIRDQKSTTRLSLVASANGPMVRAEALADVLPIEIRKSGSSYSLDIWGAHLELELGVSVVRTGDQAIQLVAAPQLQSGKLLLPLQLISDVFPSIVPNTRWDAENAQLVVFTTLGPAHSLATVRQAAEPVSRSQRPDVFGTRADESRLPPVPEKHHRRTVIVFAAACGGIVRIE